MVVRDLDDELHTQRFRFAADLENQKREAF